MGKIKIHKINISKFCDGDVLAGYIDNEKWVFVYREQENPKIVGSHCCYCENSSYFSIDMIFDYYLNCYVRNYKSHFNKVDIKGLRYATDEEYEGIIIRLNKKLNERSKNVIDEILYMIS